MTVEVVCLGFRLYQDQPCLGRVIVHHLLPQDPGKKFAAAATSPTGRYTILLMKHHGDSRGTPWYTEMVCQATDVAVSTLPLH